MNKTRGKSKKDMTQEELREIAIKQIFYFYAHQHSGIGYKSTFDSLKNQMEHLNGSEFSKFCVEFKIGVTKEKLIEIFKKTAGNVKDMSGEEFNIAGQKISVAINEEKIRLGNKKIIHLKSTGKSGRGSSTNGNANNNINTIANIQKHDIEVEIQQLKDDIKKLSGKTYQEGLNELFLYLELDDEKEYEKKMKGFNLPFNHSNGKKRVINLPKVQYYAGKSKVLNIQAAKEISKIIEQRRLENDKRKEKDNWEIGLNGEYQKKKLEENNNKHSSSIGINTAKNIMSNRGINDGMVSNNRSDSRFIMEKEVKFNNTPLRGDSKKFMVQNAPEVKDNCFSWSSLEKMNSNYFALEDEIKKGIN